METQELETAKEQLDSHIDDTLKDELSSVDLAEHLKTIKKHDETQFAKYLKELDPESLANAALEMPDHMLEDVIEIVPKDKITQGISELESDDQAELLDNISDIDENKAKEFFEELDEKDRADILKIAKYDEDEAGAYMQTEIFSAKGSETLKSAISRLKILKEKEEIENVFQLFIVDEKNHLKSAIALSDLIIYDFSLTLNEIIEKSNYDYKPHVAIDTENVNDVIQDFDEFDLNVMPVIDANGVLLGRITSDDIHDLIEDRATEQLYNLAGVNDEAEEEETVVKLPVKV